MMSVEDICKIGESDWRVIGVDPAPANKSTVCFLGENGLAFKDLKHHELLHFIQSCKGKPEVLVVWDAPLTGPPELEHLTKGEYTQGYFTQRDIEKLFMRQEYGYQPPTGINTQGYSGCQHWTITKAMTGLPLLGPYCQKQNLPFNHVSENVESKVLRGLSQPCIVEAHPALAIYLWLKDTFQKDDPVWKYKVKTEKNDGTVFTKAKKREKILSGLKTKIKTSVPETVASDDELDAFVAWALGYLYVTQSEKQTAVRILGNQKTGSMLLPYDEKLFDKFKTEFMEPES